VGSSGETQPAHQLIAEVVAESDRPVTLLAVALLTNVARALDRHPDLVDELDQIVIMGGAVDVFGNVGSLGGSDAEWNIFVDVALAAWVFASGRR
jgi:purine nucleosidase